MFSEYFKFQHLLKITVLMKFALPFPPISWFFGVGVGVVSFPIISSLIFYQLQFHIGGNLPAPYYRTTDT